MLKPSLTFPKMVEIVPERAIGVARVEHFEVTPEGSRQAAFGCRSVLDLPPDPGHYARLTVRGQLMMTDTYMEKRTNRAFLDAARGDVLIAGLGLGMIVHPVLAKEGVTSVTVVEKYADVIDLIRPTLPASDKLTLVEADIFTWQPEKGRRWHCIYFDIWPDITTDNLKQMETLHRRFGRRKKPDGWMASWTHGELKAREAREKRHEARWRW